MDIYQHKRKIDGDLMRTILSALKFNLFATDCIIRLKYILLWFNLEIFEISQPFLFLAQVSLLYKSQTNVPFFIEQMKS